MRYLKKYTIPAVILVLSTFILLLSFDSSKNFPAIQGKINDKQSNSKGLINGFHELWFKKTVPLSVVEGVLRQNGVDFIAADTQILPISLDANTVEYSLARSFAVYEDYISRREGYFVDGTGQFHLVFVPILASEQLERSVQQLAAIGISSHVDLVSPRFSADSNKITSRLSEIYAMVAKISPIVMAIFCALLLIFAAKVGFLFLLKTAVTEVFPVFFLLTAPSPLVLLSAASLLGACTTVLSVQHRVLLKHIRVQTAVSIVSHNFLFKLSLGAAGVFAVAAGVFGGMTLFVNFLAVVCAQMSLFVLIKSFSSLKKAGRRNAFCVVKIIPSPVRRRNSPVKVAICCVVGGFLLGGATFFLYKGGFFVRPSSGIPPTLPEKTAALQKNSFSPDENFPDSLKNDEELPLLLAYDEGGGDYHNLPSLQDYAIFRYHVLTFPYKSVKIDATGGLDDVEYCEYTSAGGKILEKKTTFSFDSQFVQDAISEISRLPDGAIEHLILKNSKGLSYVRGKNDEFE